MQLSMHLCHGDDIDIIDSTITGGETVPLPGLDLPAAIEAAKTELSRRFLSESGDPASPTRNAMIFDDKMRAKTLIVMSLKDNDVPQFNELVGDVTIEDEQWTVSQSRAVPLQSRTKRWWW